VLAIKIQNVSITIIIALVASGALLTITTLGLLSTTQEVPFEGTITTLNVNVYLDQECTQNCTSMSWGGVYAGESQTQKIYIKNTGNTPIELSMTITDWNPTTANGPISMAWNKENYILEQEEIVEATLTLTISENINDITDFGYKMLITGTN
jgi:hypothetical protein